MAVKVFVTQEGDATFSCPSCSEVRFRNVDQFMQKATAVRVKCKCSCGHEYIAELERRRFVRKLLELSGIYREIGGERQGLVTVMDISRSGLRMHLNVNPGLPEGARIEVEFRLDDRERSLIRREGLVRYACGLDIGIEFDSFDHYDKLGPYLAFN